MTTEELDDILVRGIDMLGAASATLYVQDPYWIDEYRLVCMPGVRIREPMYGFMFPESAKRAIAEGDAEIFCTELDCDPRSHEKLPPLPPEIKKDLRILFSGFALREGVRSYVRLFHPNSSSPPEAILFVNFNSPTEFDEGLREQVRELLAQIIGHLPALTQHLKEVDAGPLAESVKILRPAQAMARSLQEPPAKIAQLQRRFELILKRCLETLGISHDSGLGTVHLVDAESQTLKLAAFCGNITDVNKATSQDISSGQGVISWVVLRHRSVLIEDMDSSQFRSIHVRLNPEVRSELAVPMVADGVVVGVLNLEATTVKAFSPHSVRSIWYAANSAALAYQLSQQSSLNRTLLQICWRASTDQDGARSSLNDLATLLQQALHADLCDIWHFNSHLRRFDAAGASYRPFEPAIRAEGWSSCLRKQPRIVWIDSIKSLSDYEISEWRDKSWYPADSDRLAPDEVNPRLKVLGVEAELGLPITVGGQCVGVAWVKFAQPVPPPARDLMEEAILLAGQAGLVLDSIQHQLEMPDRRAVERIGAQLKSSLFMSGPLDLGELRCLEGYILHSSAHPDVCGDFHTLKLINDSTVGLLLVDGEGHALTGLLNALPMIATAEVFGNDSGSSRHLMDKLMSMSNDLGVRGNALYCTLTLIEGSVWISATSAGNVHLLLIRKHPGFEARQFPAPGDPARGTSLGFRLRIPLAEAHEQLHSGDILIGYTDGITDALGVPTELEAGTLAGLALEHSLQSAQEIAAAVMKPVSITPLSDDATVFVIKVA